MKSTKLSLLCLACAMFAPLSALCSEEVSVTDGFGIEWFGYRSNTVKTVFTYEAGRTTMTNLDSDSYVWGYLPKGSPAGTVKLVGTSHEKIVAEVVGGAGILFPQGDESALAGTIMRLATDKDFYAHTATACSRRAQNFDIRKTAAEYLKIYDEVCADFAERKEIKPRERARS